MTADLLPFQISTNKVLSMLPYKSAAYIGSRQPTRFSNRAKVQYVFVCVQVLIALNIEDHISKVIISTHIDLQRSLRQTLHVKQCVLFSTVKPTAT